MSIITEDESPPHSFAELYCHRTALFAALMKANPSISYISRLHSDGTFLSGMFIGGMTLPTGQITYHMEMKYWSMFSGITSIEILDRAPEWDGHSSDTVVDRLIDWTKQ